MSHCGARSDKVHRTMPDTYVQCTMVHAHLAEYICILPCSLSSQYQNGNSSPRVHLLSIDYSFPAQRRRGVISGMFPSCWNLMLEPVKRRFSAMAGAVHSPKRRPQHCQLGPGDAHLLRSVVTWEHVPKLVARGSKNT